MRKCEYGDAALSRYLQINSKMFTTYSLTSFLKYGIINIENKTDDKVLKNIERGTTMTFREIIQHIICYSETTERIADTISYLFFSRVGKIKKDYIKYHENHNPIGICYPNFFFDTYMFIPKGENISIPIYRGDIEKLN